MSWIVNELPSDSQNTPENKGSLSFWKNTILVIFFLTVAPLTILVSSFSLFAFDKHQDNSQEAVDYPLNLIKLPQAGIRVYASLPVNAPTVSGEAGVADARPEILKQYMESYDSPLAPFSYEIVQNADKYGLDFRLTTAIAQQESNLCKLIPPQSNNCWGWGIHSRGTLGFNSYPEAIEEVSKGLREEYLDKGYADIEKIMSKYTPLSNGSWAYGVNKFMGEMQ